MIIHYDRAGRPISLMEWVALFGDSEGRRVGYDELYGYQVSTVWLGIDHNFGAGPPLIFETMVFGPEGGFDVDCRRYSTEDQARTGHEDMLTLIRATAQGVEDLLPEEQEARCDDRPTSQPD
jgi:hypothetical protein